MRFKNAILTILAVVLCMAAFSFPVSANISADTETSTYTDEELSVNDNVESKTPLTPNGNLTIVDDVRQVSDEDSIEDKQFITVQSKNGNTFYIIIDRSGDTENVYFLNAVDETDLLALMEDEQKEQVTVCTCTSKCEPGSVNTDCPVCSNNMNGCTATAASSPAPTEKEPAEENKSSSASIIILILFVLLGAGGAFYWFKIKNKKSSTKGDTDPNDLFDEDEDYEIEETEPEQDYEVEDDDNEDREEKDK